MEDTLAQVRAAYDHDPEWEWRRLDSGAQYRLEHLVTMHALKRHLPALTQDRPCHVLDAGGGPRRYTLALAAQGYTMSLFDLSPALLALARWRIAESGPAVCERVPAVVEGSITDLARFGDEQFDAVLCLGGVLSHVIEDALRRQALAELLHTILSAPAGDGYRRHRPWSRADVLLSPGGICLVVGRGGPRTGAVVWLQRSGRTSSGRSPQRINGRPGALANMAQAVAGDL